MNLRYIFTLIFFSGFLSLQAQNLVITNNLTAQQLADALTGPGINDSNATGQLDSAGTGIFINNGVAGFTLTGGIILSTGEVGYGMAPASYHHSTDLGLPGDPQLDAIVMTSLTEDAEVLEFDFSAGNDSVEFNFMFASEEYNDYVNTSFNDVFAFFITGPGYSPNTNVALLPGTSTPISINNVNNGLSSGTSAGPCENCSYYIDNVGTNAIDMCYDGFTTVINIKFPVWPCSDYHFKIAIADVADGVFDSAVLLEENSFIPCPSMQATQHGLPVNTVTICNGGSATLTAPQGVTYNWTTGETTQSIIVTQPGTYGFTITNPALPSCFAFSDIITVIQAGVIQTPVIIQNNNLLEAPNVIPGPGITYQWYQDGLPINGATQSTLTILANGCYTLTIFEGTCESTSNEICITNTSLYELNANSISVYPHPVTDISIIETPFTEGSVTTLKLKDINGRGIYSVSEVQIGQLKIEKGNLRPGIYLLEISNNNYQGILTRKLIIQ